MLTCKEFSFVYLISKCTLYKFPVLCKHRLPACCIVTSNSRSVMTYVGQPSLDVEHLYNTHNKCCSIKRGLNWINLSKVPPPYSRTHLLGFLSVPRYLRKIWTLLKIDMTFNLCDSCHVFYIIFCISSIQLLIFPPPMILFWP